LSARSPAAAAVSSAAAIGRGAVEAVKDKRAGRRVWARGDHAYVEVRGLHDADGPPGYVDALERGLTARDGVRWAAVNRVLGDVIVEFDSTQIGVEQLRETVTEVERAHGMAAHHRGRPVHPSDFEQVFDRLLELVADLLGAAIGMVGQIAPGLRLPVEALALPAAADLLPAELKRRMDQRFGAIRVELVLSLLGSVIGAATHAPLSTLVDAALRAVEMSEALASRRTWERRARDLAADYTMARAERLPSPGARPAPLPEGAAERYARRAKLVTGIAAVPGLIGGGLRGGARAILLGAPKAATMGTDAFAAELGRILANRGVVVRDPAPLRCLDRIDTVIIDASALTTGRMNVVDVVTTVAGAAAERAGQRVQRMFDPQRPRRLIRDGHWRLGPVPDLDVSVPDDLAAVLRRAGKGHDAALGLARDRRLIAVALLTAPADPLLEAVVQAAHQLGRVMVAPARRRLVEQARADGSVAGGSRLAASVRALQSEGRVVAVIAGGNEPALAAADCGIGIVTAGTAPPWAAHLLCGPGLTDAWLILQAAGCSRAAANRSGNLALLGAITGLVTGWVGPDRSRSRRSTLPVNIAALASIIASVWSVNQLARRPPPVTSPGVPWHAMGIEDTLRELRTSMSGLTETQAAERRMAEVEEADEPVSIVPATVDELRNPLTGPLAAGAGLSAVTGSVVDALLVASVMAGNAALGAAQRVAASRAVHSLAAASTLKVRRRRGGSEDVAPATELVPGDVVVVQAGDVVPADCRLVDANQLEMNESNLTGESMLVAKDPEPTWAAAVADRTSMLYAGTTVAAGVGTAVVVATGRATEAGRSSAAAKGATAPGGVEAKLARMTAASVPVAAGAAGALLATGLLRGRLAESIPSAVALAVAAVPEGLPFTATVAQLAAARRLSRRGVLVRNPRTLEALGRVNVVCFDKTGTLTAGKIDLSRVSDGRTDEGVEALSSGRRLVLAAALRASPEQNGDLALPHPTDRAVNRGGESAGINREDGAPGWRMVRELPFEPGRGFHAVLGRYGPRNIISVKGAPETVLPRCAAVRDDTGTHPLRRVDRNRLAERAADLAHSGYRVLAVAERSATNRRELGVDHVERLEFLGFLGLSDPIRPTAAKALSELRRAGVEIMMLTGDHPNTATAVGSELGILDGRSPVTGPEMDRADEAGLAELASRSQVFARVSPSHKVAIVEALHRAGRVVAVTGDGANDAPAMHLADVGIAVGGQSTDATRQAADIIVTDERIETIVDAVIESRAMWRSVRDSVELLVGGNLGEILFTTGSSLASARPPLNPRQLLLVNLLTDLVPALAVAVRPPRHVTADMLLREGPEAVVGSALTHGVVRRALATATAATGGWLAARATGTPTRSGTVALTSLVGAQLAQTAVAARGDPVVLAAVAGSAAALVGIVSSPPTSAFFGCRPLGPLAWGITLAASAAGAALGVALPDSTKLVNAVADGVCRLPH
jgi:cation-transporting P-type ATPase I